MLPADLLKLKSEQRKSAALAVYDASFARLAHKAGCDWLLVGDSLGMAVQGRKNTHGVSVRDIIYHTRCCALGAPGALLAADLPFGSFEAGPERAFASAAKLMAAGARMVKVEGGAAIAATVATLAARGIPVCGHVGLQPQTATAGGYRMTGKSEADSKRIYEDACAVSEAGAALVVLEMIPAVLAQKITRDIGAATVGIGAGNCCDGQILVSYDMLGIFRKIPPFAKNFLPEAGTAEKAVCAYVAAVKDGSFPDAEHTPA